MKKTKEKLLLVLLSVIFAFAMIITPNMQTAKAADDETTAEAEEVITDDFVDNEILVVMDELVGGINKVIPIDFFKDLKLNISKIEDLTLSTDSYIDYYNELDEEDQNFHQILKITLPVHSKSLVLKTVKALNSLVGVEFAEPNYIQQVCSVANDPYFYQQWGYHSELGADVLNAWNITTGSRAIRVGIIDSGIDLDHPDLVDNLVEGKSFVDNVTTADDTYGHGTHVAGIIGAVGDNNLGVSGVCKKVSLVPLRVSVDQYVETDKIVKAINYAKNLWGKESQISVLNLSAGQRKNDSALKNAIGNYPGLFVVAGGNSAIDIDSCDYYPASYDIENTIVVGALAAYNRKWIDSNYGSKKIDIFAPGANIKSTVLDGSYDYKSGTSMAAPFVTGVAALMLSVNPDLSAKELKASIMGNARIVNDNGTNPIEGLCVTNGILDAYKAVSSVALDMYGTSVMGLQENASREVRHVTIPKTYNNISITALDVRAFNNYTKLESFCYNNSMSIPSTVLDGCTSLKTVREEGGSSFGSGGLSENFSSWRTIAELPILNYGDLQLNGKNTLTVDYNAYFSVYGSVKYQFRLLDNQNNVYSTSPIYTTGNGENHSRTFKYTISDLSSIPSGSQLRVQIRYRKNTLIWGGHFTMTGKYLQLNIA